MSFSKRHGYKSPEKEITVREAAPAGLRASVIQMAYAAGYTPKAARTVICRTLLVQPDPTNFSDYPNIDYENYHLLDDCEWFRVYDIIEALTKKAPQPEEFTDLINDYFRREGIGWQLEKSEIIYRGTDSFEAELRKGEQALAAAGLKTATNELREAITDLSRRPSADITGAVQHSLACVECAAREASGGSKETLGALIKRRRDLVPPPLDVVIDKMYGFASNQGRHLEEGKAPSYEEAELLVGLSAALVTYLGRKFTSPTAPSTTVDDDDSLPF